MISLCGESRTARAANGAAFSDNAILAALAIRVALASISWIHACDFRRAGRRAANRFLTAPQVEERAQSTFPLRAVGICLTGGGYAGSALAIAVRCAQPAGAVHIALAFVDDAQIPAIPARSRGTLHGQPRHQETAPAVAVFGRATLVRGKLDLAFCHRQMQISARAWSFGSELKARRRRWLICAGGVRATTGLRHKVSTLHVGATTSQCDPKTRGESHNRDSHRSTAFQVRKRKLPQVLHLRLRWASGSSKRIAQSAVGDDG